jgi:ferredoxin-NADP reductase
MTSISRGFGGRRRDDVDPSRIPPDDAAKAATRVFVCGPTPFVGTVTRLLVDQGYKPRAIRAEDFGTPG